ncbi:outer membrane protein assembly factor BamA [Aquabacterium sp. J223]|uniref:outer membrane protein assembly factor BamA n=1 Tax=Aquabacterium sp. J223 TaxID=2898431 RepID=UPI0021AE02E6|nr:outer membrane protein assembly factor BamA [Aquabacterium sp. J223]UUX97040.1 outer membrane protein assembly factor BamA [Aquabacterium sp. J223]
MHPLFAPSALRPVAACVAVVAAAFPALPALAVEPFTVSDIRIEGLQRTDPGTVFAALGLRVGDLYSDDKGAAALRALFATGLFKDVRLEVEGNVLVVIVDERAVIGAVSFVGLREFDKDTLLKALRDSGIGEGLPYDRAVVDRAEQEIKRQYLSKSLYGAEVVTTVTPQERNRVAITFTMVEGDVARIREIRILGAKAFSEGTLRGLFDLRTPNWLSWYTKSDRYSRTKLNADLETLRAYYTNRGYLEFNVESAQVTISPDKQDITITVTVREGQPYTVTGVRLEGDFLGKEDEFKSLVRVKPGEAYRAEDVAETQRAFAERFGSYGYAFARVEARPQIDRERAQVMLVLAAEPQRRVYVRRINVAGNTRTRDEVVRREFRQFESSWYDGQKIKLSRDRVDRLGYFKEVSVETNEVPGAPDQVDLLINVAEKPTGNLMLGAGYSSVERVALTAAIKQENVFGSGNYLGVEVNTSRSYRTLSVSTVDPYFTADGVSRAVDVYYRTTRPLNSIANTFSLATVGSAIRFGVPFTEYDTVFVGVGVEQTRVVGNFGLPLKYITYATQYGADTTIVPVTIGWSRDDRDSGLNPTRGGLNRVNLEMSPFGDTQYLRTNLQAQRYFPLGPRFTLMLNGEVGVGSAFGGRPFPVFKYFYGGGLGSIRGFSQSSLGEIDNTGAYLGGTKRLNLNTELYVPVPGSGNDKTLRIFGFTDVGNVWGDGQKITGNSLRASVGVGLSWISPLGPLKVSYGVPVRNEPNDRIQRFQFQIGTAF